MRKSNFAAAITVGPAGTRSHMNVLTMTVGEFKDLDLKVPTHQRQAFAWKASDMMCLIDTIARGWTFPSVFVRVKEDRRTLEDGLQRNTTLSTFLRGDIGLPSGTIFNMPESWVNPLTINQVDPDDFEDDDEDMIVVDAVEGLAANQYDASGKRFNELPKEIVDQILNTEICVMEMHNFSDEEAREYFQRLQGGKPLNAAERRRAANPRLANLAKKVVASKQTESFFQALNLKPSNNKLSERQAKNNRLQAEEAAVGLMVIASNDEMPALTMATKTALADAGINQKSPEFDKTIQTLEVLGKVTEQFTADELKLIKATTVPPLFKVALDQIDDGELTTKTQVSEFADKLKGFLSEVGDTDGDASESVEQYRMFSSSGSNSQTSLQGRYKIMKNRLTV